ALELHRAASCDFDLVVFTNLTQDHLDFHLSLEDYFMAKRRLFAGGDYGRDRVALLNMDDHFGRRMKNETDLALKGFGLYRDVDYLAADVDTGPGGSRFKVVYDRGSIDIRTELRGIFNVYNCLAAVSVALEKNIDAKTIADGIVEVKGVPGRFESVDCGQGFMVIVDYAHTPDGVRNLLEASRGITSGRVISVVGCGGDRDRSKRALMGEAGASLSDLCIFTSDNPRSEDPLRIIDMMVEGVRGKISEEKYLVEADRRKAIKQAISIAGEGDTVVIAGKGHERGQIFSNSIVPFDDREVARECIEEVRLESS
ncbi:MAG: UDP-N-acetylmuramoyl-L-alanyl-D-glutamate--2,6-diaminopimelate ligase, partial [Actinobacteria bacterium]|nr:UDP-N-acetylmuramoyl-L-alanyl-D-glutamate--2,6-diaminopimelate ligase [Actinomycetota bacterium]